MGTKSGKSEEEGKLVGPIVVYAPTVRTDKFLAEEVWDKKHDPVYLVYDFEKDTIEEQARIDLGETKYDRKAETFRSVIYEPVDNDHLRKGLVLVPQKATETTFKSLMKEKDEFVSICYDACGRDDEVKLLSNVAVSSWWGDRFVRDRRYDIAGAGKFAPIIAIRSPSGTGKNRLSFCLRMLSYRPYYNISTYRIPSLFRPLDIWKGTLVLDEADFANTNENSELAHYLNSRTYGTPISRVDPNNPNVSNAFDNFQLTVLTQRRYLDDPATESRAIPYNSEKTDKRLPTLELDEWMEKGYDLQNKELYLRFKYFNKVLIDKSAWIEGINDPRLNSALLAMLALSEFEPSLLTSMTTTGKKIEREKIRLKAQSGDGLVINHLWGKLNQPSEVGDKIVYTPLVDLWNNNYFFLDRIEEEKQGEGKEPKITKHALTTSIIEHEYGFTAKELRKIIDSFHLANPELPAKIRPHGSKKPANWIPFEPRKLEKHLKDFVVDYEPGMVFEVLGLKQDTLPVPGSGTSGTSGTKEVDSSRNVPHVPHVPDSSVGRGEKVALPHPGCPGILHADIYPDDNMPGHVAMCDKCGRVETITKGSSGWIVVHPENHNGR